MAQVFHILPLTILTKSSLTGLSTTSLLNPHQSLAESMVDDYVITLNQLAYRNLMKIFPAPLWNILPPSPFSLSLIKYLYIQEVVFYEGMQMMISYLTHGGKARPIIY